MNEIVPHNEIATGFSSPRNDEFVNTTICPIRHCEGRRLVAIHKSLIINTKTENKKKSLIIEIYIIFILLQNKNIHHQ